MEFSSVSTTTVNCQGPVENSSEESSCNIGATLLGQEAVVFFAVEDKNALANSSSSLSGSSVSEQAVSPTPREIEINVMEIRKRCLKHVDKSDQVMGTLLQARKKMTNTTYHRIWKCFFMLRYRKKLRNLWPLQSLIN